MLDFSIFLTAEAWISLITLLFLEIVLGVDNIVFIAITTNRLPHDKQHIGRKLGLAGAMIMRILFLCFASYLVHMTNPLFNINLGSFSHGFSVRDLVLFCGGAYLIYKGITETRDVLHLTEQKAASGSKEHKEAHMITLGQAVGTIMVMDIVFSIDSVITAVGMAEHLLVMVLAVVIAILLMMIFIDQVSDFINKHPEMKILALTFIVAIGILLVLDGLGINSGIEALGMHAEKLMVYFAMAFAFVLELIQMAFNKNLAEWRRERWEKETDKEVDRVREQMQERLNNAKEHTDQGLHPKDSKDLFTPVFIGQNVYVMMPMDGESADSFRNAMSSGDTAFEYPPIELDAEFEDVSPKSDDTTVQPEGTDAQPKHARSDSQDQQSEN